MMPSNLTKHCLECGKSITMKIKRDVDRKKYCSMSCRSRNLGKKKDMALIHLGRRVQCERIRAAQKMIHMDCVDCGKQRLVRDTEKAKLRAGQRCQKCAARHACKKDPNLVAEKRKRTLKEWTTKNKARQKLYWAAYRDKIRLEMVHAYGGKCLHCGIDDPVVLVLDHINDDGAEQRGKLKRRSSGGGFRFYTKLRRDGWPKGEIQLLCHNCNYKKEAKRRRDAII